MRLTQAPASLAAACITLWAPFGLCKPYHVPFYRAEQPTLASAERRASSQKFGVTNIQSSFFVTANVGQNPTAFNLALHMDIGDIYLAGAGCGVCPAGNVGYNPNPNDPSVNLIDDGFGSFPNARLTGQVWTDSVSLGPYKLQNFAVLSIVSAVGTLPPGPIFPAPISGVMGLGPRADLLTTATVQPIEPKVFWQEIFTENQAPAAEFGLWIRPENSSNPISSGSIIFGGVDTTLYSGDVEFLDASSGGPGNGAWMLNLTSIIVGGLTIDVSVHPVVMSMESTLIIGPASAVTAFWSKVPGASTTVEFTDQFGQGYHSYPCDSKVTATVSFGGRAWTLDWSLMNAGPEQVECHSSLPCTPQCFGAVVACVEPCPQWSFGTPFLGSVYSVYRFTPFSIGFADLGRAAGGSVSASGILPPTLTSSSGTSSGSSTPTGGSPSPPPSSPLPHPKKSLAGPIAGGVIGGLALLLGVLFVLYCRRKHARSREAKEDQIIPAGAVSGFPLFEPEALYGTGGGAEMSQTSTPVTAGSGKGPLILAPPPAQPQPSPSSESPSALNHSGVTINPQRLSAATTPASAHDPELRREVDALRAEVLRLQEIAEDTRSASDVPPPSYHHRGSYML
ncbi:aspartic peptidase domain-containing protein [Mycena amicta]|nr:aspartic peptidase domain-containing protein [Mycena amicta]